LALAGPLKDIQKPFVQKPVLGVIVLFTPVLSALEQVFIKDLCTLFCSSFPRSRLVSQSTPLKNIPQHDAATTMLHHRDGARLPPDMMLGIQAKEFNLGFLRPDNLVSHGPRVLYETFGKLSGL
jgi:hypothetical protein